MAQFRSETMKRGTLVVPSDRAREFIDLIGRHVNLEIVDMNEGSMNRPYKRYIQRIDDMERILRFLFEEIENLPGAQITKHNTDNFLEHDTMYNLEQVEASLQKLYEEFSNFRANNMDLLKQKNRAMEERAVAMVASHSLEPQGGLVGTMEEDTEHEPNKLLLDDAEGTASSKARQPFGKSTEREGGAFAMFGNIAGVISEIDQNKFARTIFRATRGNAYTHFESVRDYRIGDTSAAANRPAPTPQLVYVNEPADSFMGLGGEIIDALSELGQQDEDINFKTVLVIYFQGSRTSAIHDRIQRICDAFGVNTYDWPRSNVQARKKVSELSSIIKDKIEALFAYEEYMVDAIKLLLQTTRVGGNSLIEEWRLFAIKEKSLYAVLNLFEGRDVTLRAECWYPDAEEDKIYLLLNEQSNNQQVSAFLLRTQMEIEFASHESESRASTPPTYFRTNDFTYGFQEFVNTYGMPRYKEANPATTTMITLPLLFGIMYGDIGHGALVLSLGIYLALFWHSSLKNSGNEIILMIGGGRFILILMGVFAIFMGTIYNDFFGIGIDLFGTRYIQESSDSLQTTYTRDPDQSVYPFGFDPIWKGSTDEVAYFNSFKMKLSVIMAFFQMGIGVLHKGWNARFFKDDLTFWYEFVPQIIFLTGFVGWLDFMIFYKWLVPMDNPPNLISALINTFFFTVENPLFENQFLVQNIIVLVMLICVPWMLLPKPFIEKGRHQKSIQMDNIELGAQATLAHLEEGMSLKVDYQLQNSTPEPFDLKSKAHPEFEFAEVFIHQLIETIEFVIGAISNTASYLRLWALSLAHQQLSLVFFDNIMITALELKTNVVIQAFVIFFAFGFFAAVTCGVMLFMDALECFLHALRLQWVEFQNKFYKADGRRFLPLNFKSIVAEEALE